MTFTIIGLIIGIMIFGAGVYYLVKEKEDRDSVKIYGTAVAVGAAISVWFVARIIMVGF